MGHSSLGIPRYIGGDHSVYDPEIRRCGNKGLAPLVMTYNIDGRTYKGEHVREVHRLIYESESDWTDTVTESDPIQSGAGTVHSVGSYRRLNGTRYEEYDSINDHYIVETVADNVLMAPNAFARPISVPYLKSNWRKRAKVVSNHVQPLLAPVIANNVGTVLTDYQSPLRQKSDGLNGFSPTIPAGVSP